MVSANSIYFEVKIGSCSPGEYYRWIENKCLSDIVLTWMYTGKEIFCCGYSIVKGTKRVLRNTSAACSSALDRLVLNIFSFFQANSPTSWRSGLEPRMMLTYFGILLSSNTWMTTTRKAVTEYYWVIVDILACHIL